MHIITNTGLVESFNKCVALYNARNVLAAAGKTAADIDGLTAARMRATRSSAGISMDQLVARKLPGR